MLLFPSPSPFFPRWLFPLREALTRSLVFSSLPARPQGEVFFFFSSDLPAVPAHLCSFPFFHQLMTLFHTQRNKRSPFPTARVHEISFSPLAFHDFIPFPGILFFFPLFGQRRNAFLSSVAIRPWCFFLPGAFGDGSNLFWTPGRHSFSLPSYHPVSLSPSRFPACE